MNTRLHLSLFFALPLLAGHGAESAPPKLAVVIAVDQMRADYLVRFRPHFGEGGFKRLLEGGLDFRNAHYRHAITQTAPGHALMLSGVHADVHSIIGNDWIDRTSWEKINSVEDRDSPLVGIDPRELGPILAAVPAKTGRSPRNFAAATVGDQLKLKYGEKSKVFAVANKDRSAILLGGRLADAAYWDELGRFVTARHYRAALPPWVVAFNAERRAPAAFGRVWERLLAPAVYEAVQGPDDAPGEGSNFGYNRVFPKRVTGGKDALSPAFYEAYDVSPFTTEALGEFVQRAIVEEQLGRHTATDLLCVSFSQVDAIGHGFGPNSHEVMDSMLRLDRVLATLLDCIDREVGLQHCVIVLTADHGVAPLPERAPDTPTGRMKLADLDLVVTQALVRAFGALPSGEIWFVRDNYAYHVRPAALAARNILAGDAAKVIKTALVVVPAIGGAYTREELLGAEPADDPVLAMARRSYNAGRGRDVLFFPKPYFLFSSSVTGTSHGAPYDYDTHVPLLWFGAGVPRGVRTERVGIDDLAPTFAALLKVPAPEQAKGRQLW